MAGERGGTEIRVGLVMYGGVSLAVYMNGVAREFYDMVKGRGTWGAWKILADVDVVVDVVSGASAGGINGLFLAKALAAKREFEPLADLWRMNAGIDDLLRDAEERDPRSLLDSDYMREQLTKAFDKIDSSPPAANADLCPSRVEELDCFVATTHYYGFDKTLHDGRGKPVEVRSHRAMLRFRHREGRREPFSSSRNGGRQGLSAAELATVARATSAFPFAFRPEELNLETFAPYFVGEDENLSGKAWFVDGGILDNKPFGATLSAIFERRADRPVDRLLFYIEPDPERFEGIADAPEPRFDQVAVGALTWLPAYESILGDLDSIDIHNRRLERIAQIFGDAMQPWDVARQSAPVSEQQLELYWRSRIDDVLSSLLEPMKDAVLEGLLESLALSGEQSFTPAKGSARARAIRTLMGMLRTPPNTELPAEPLTRPLEGLDLAFLKRSVYYWIYALHKGLGTQRDNGIAPEWLACWKGLTDTPNRKDLSEAVRRLNEIADGIQVLEAGVARSIRSADVDAVSLDGFVRSWLNGVGDVNSHVNSLTAWRADWGAQRSMAYRFKDAPSLDGPQSDVSLATALSLARALADTLNAVVAAVLPRVRAMETFFNIDMWQFPALHLADVAEMDRIEYFRISPVDSAAPSPWLPNHRWERDGMRKVAGRSLAHFSAFLKRSWRSNDILWGRLDAATIAWDAFVNARNHTTIPDRNRIEELKALLNRKPKRTAEEEDLLKLLDGLSPNVTSDELQRQLLICHQRNIVAEELPRVMGDAMDEELRRRARQSGSAGDARPLTSSDVHAVAISVLAQFDDACSDPFLRRLAKRAVQEIQTNTKFALEPVFSEDYDIGGETVRDLPSPWLEATALQAARVFANMIKGLASEDHSLGAWAQKRVFTRASAILTALHWVMISRQSGWFAPIWLVATVGTLGAVIATFFREKPWSAPIDYGVAAFFVALLFVPRQWFVGDRRIGTTRRMLRVAITLAIPVIGYLLWPMIPESVSTTFLVFSIAANALLVLVALWALMNWIKATKATTQARSRTASSRMAEGPKNDPAGGVKPPPQEKARAAAAKAH